MEPMPCAFSLSTYVIDVVFLEFRAKKSLKRIMRTVHFTDFRSLTRAHSFCTVVFFCIFLASFDFITHSAITCICNFPNLFIARAFHSHNSQSQLFNEMMTTRCISRLTRASNLRAAAAAASKQSMEKISSNRLLALLCVWLLIFFLLKISMTARLMTDGSTLTRFRFIHRCTISIFISSCSLSTSFSLICYCYF